MFSVISRAVSKYCIVLDTSLVQQNVKYMYLYFVGSPFLSVQWFYFWENKNNKIKNQHI
jgi:hypothetical protein